MADSLKKRLKLGATGAYPRGKLDDNDGGELRFALIRDGDTVRFEFGTTLSWFAMSTNDAKNLAAMLMQCAAGGKSN